MNRLSQVFSRLRRAFRPGAGKAGSSLALVMMIGAALVIWVMCIMPLMTTTGTTAIQTEEKYDDYLESKSSIEFCKSELEDIVTREIPYTFAVVRTDDDKFNAIRRNDKDTGALDTTPGGYTTYVNVPDALDASLDKPQDNDSGNKATAICAVEWNTLENQYDITVTTYHNGEKGQIFTLVFTPSGSLLIFPEAYNKAQALPLSDFVVVDGKLGSTVDEDGNTVANQIWDSGIDMGNAVNASDKTTGDFEEHLKAWKNAPADNYANSQEYPAVFKKTAEAAEYDREAPVLGTPLSDGKFSNENWNVPTAVSASYAPKSEGNIWMDASDGNIHIYLYATREDGTVGSVDITNDCTVYLNGDPSTDRRVPTQEGVYCVTVDYPGTGDYSENKVNVLPAAGLQMNELVGTVGSKKQSLPDCSVEKVEQVGDTYTVTLSETSYTDLLYACCSEEDPGTVIWSDVNTFEGLPGGTTYYFYIFRYASMEDGTFYEQSEVKYVGMIYPMELVQELESSSNYLVLGKNGSNYYAMNSQSSGNYLQASPVSLVGEYVDPSFNTNGCEWTATSAGDQWSFQSSNNNYLSMTGSINRRLQWSFALGTAGSSTNELFTVKAGQNGDVSVSRNVTASNSNSQKKDAYLSFSTSNTRFEATGTSSTVYFMKLPNAAPAVSAPTQGYKLDDNSMVYGTSAMAHVKDNLSPKDTDVTVEKLYVNGVERNPKLNAGVYNLVAQVKDSNFDYSYCVALGSLTVTKADLSSDPVLEIASCKNDGNDEMTVSVTGSGWHENGGERWIGYWDSGKGIFQWFPVTGGNSDTYTFRLPYGTYEFAVRESGSKNYNGVTSASSKFTISPTRVTLAEADPSDFSYTLNRTSGLVTWYKLPDAAVVDSDGNIVKVDNGDGTISDKTISLFPLRVHLVYGVPNGDDITWQEAYDDSVCYYGVIVENSTDCSELTHALQISPPANISISDDGLYTSSMMRGSSLYFMGQNNSIDTHGTDIYLTTDLLVLNYDITGGGHVYVEPYSTGDTAPGDTLLFTIHAIERNGETVFEAKTFYKIEPDTDINNISAANAASLKCGKIADTVDVEIQYYFRQGIYPEINLDIAYANDKQLAHILSSETIGWTVHGELRNSDDNSANSAYVVCTYVNKVANAVSCRANRILIAAKDADTTCALKVPYDLTFTTRYLSIDAKDVVQEDGEANFIIKSLGQDQDFLTWLGGATGLTPYHSKTLQIDFEQKTAIHTGGSIASVDKQICRYDDGTDLFNPAIQPLMVTYTASEINGWFNSLSTAAKTVDRYTSLKGDETSHKIDVGSLFTCSLDIYTNYLYIDGSIDEISVAGLLSNDIRIHSQESGYTDKEYLGLFTEHSTESYNGTLVYIAENVTFKYRTGLFSTKSVTIEKGFYYVYSLDEGTSLKTLATDLFTGDDLTQNTEKKPFRVDSNSLKDYSIYIDKDGNISNAYVDTGLFDNTSIGLGGFSRGTVG